MSTQEREDELLQTLLGHGFGIGLRDSGYKIVPPKNSTPRHKEVKVGNKVISFTEGKAKISKKKKAKRKKNKKARAARKKNRGKK